MKKLRICLTPHCGRTSTALYCHACDIRQSAQYRPAESPPPALDHVLREARVQYGQGAVVWWSPGYSFRAGPGGES